MATTDVETGREKYKQKGLNFFFFYRTELCRVWKSYRVCRSSGYGYVSLTGFTEVPSRCVDAGSFTREYPCLGYCAMRLHNFQKSGVRLKIACTDYAIYTWYSKVYYMEGWR